MRIRTQSLALLAFTALSGAAFTTAAHAAANGIYVSEPAGNSFNSDLSSNPVGSNGDTLVAVVTNGTGNTGAVTQQSSIGTFTNSQQNGSNNEQFINYAAGTNGGNIQVFQGNSAQEAAINKQVVNVANHNSATATESGTNNTSLIVQKGNENTNFSTVGGTNSNATVIQEMVGVANGDIVDPVGNHYRGGNDSVVVTAGNGDNININQYQGNVSKVNAQGDSNTVNLQQVNTLFTANRVYNNVSVVNENGTHLTANVNQSGAGELSTITQTGGGAAAGAGNTASVSQFLGGGNATISQDGTGEKSIVSQTASNTVVHTQTGPASANNSGNFTQNGGSNTAGLAQTGTGNNFTSNQQGNTNVIGANSSQNGSANTATLSQLGTSNSVTLTQSGGSNTADLHQINNDARSGGPGNTMNLSQNGTGNVFLNTYQYGFNNAYTASVTGNTNSVYITQGVPTNPTAGEQGENTTAKVTVNGSGNTIAGHLSGLNDVYNVNITGSNNYLFGDINNAALKNNADIVNININGSSNRVIEGEDYATGNPVRPFIGGVDTIDITGDSNSIQHYSDNGTQSGGNTSVSTIHTLNDTVFGNNNVQNINQQGGLHTLNVAIGSAGVLSSSNNLTVNQTGGASMTANVAMAGNDKLTLNQAGSGTYSVSMTPGQTATVYK